MSPKSEKTKSSLLEFCRGLPGATEDVKWDGDLVFSVGGKMFAVFPVADESRASFKTTPAAFSMLTSQEGIVPAPYVARYNWVLVEDLHAVPENVLQELLHESYELVVARLPTKVQQTLGGSKK